jgi:[methyl-Co(III) methanol-specific corrinoid protein]:coenzyme M methyltransferase
MFLSALQGEKPDRTPLAHISALTTVELQEAVGCFMPDVHLNAEKLVRLCAANHEMLGFDAVTFIINYFNEPAALGCDINWGGPNELPVFTSHPWQSQTDARIPADILSRQPISTYIEAIGLAKDKYGDKLAVLGKVMGPLSMVQVMHGIDRTMMGLIDEPALIRHYLDVAVELLVRCANAQFDAGADAVAIGEGGAGSNMLSPAMHEEFLLDVHKKMIREIKGPTVMHICGDITPRLNLLAETDLACFNFDWAVKPVVMKDLSRGKFTIMGNVNTGDLLRGSPEEIERQVKENLDAGVDIISPGCAVSPECSLTNLRVLSETINKYQ